MNRLFEIIRNNKGLFWGLTILAVWILPGYLLANSNYSLGYDYIQNIRVAASENETRLLPLNVSGFNYMPEHQGSEILKLLIIKVTGIQIQDLQIFPIGAFLVPLAFYLLCCECFDRKLAAILSISIAFDPTVVLSSYHTAIYSWSRPLLLMLIFLYIKILKKKSPSMVFLTVVIFISLFLIYWTDPSLIVIFAFFINIIIFVNWFFFERHNNPIPKALTVSIALAFLVINLGLGQFIYGILPRIFGQDASGQFGEAVFSLYQRIMILIGAMQPTEEVFSSYGESSPILIIQIIRYALIIIPITILAIIEFRHLIAKQKFQVGQDINQIILWAIVGMLLFHTILYSSYGHASTRYVALFGPFVGIIAVDRCNASKGIKWGYAIILGTLACASFFIEYPQTLQQSKWSEVKPAVSWFIEKSETRIMLSNVGTFGMFAVEGASIGTIPTFVCYSDATYNEIIGKNTTLGKQIDTRFFIVIDKNETNQEMCPGFKFFEPIINFLKQIEENGNLDLIYDNGAIWILKPK